MYLAADCRYREGRLLLQQGHRDGGIYLLGYVAEMVLKLGYCRLDRAMAMDSPVASRMVVAQQRWRSVFRGTSWRTIFGHNEELDRHNLVALWLCIQDGRQRLGLPTMEREVARLADFYVYAIDENWLVAMRYRGQYATESEAITVRDAVEWLYTNQAELWRE